MDCLIVSSLPSSTSSSSSASSVSSAQLFTLHSRFFTSSDLLLTTTYFLSHVDLLTLSSVSSSLHSFADSDLPWRGRLLSAQQVMRPEGLDVSLLQTWFTATLLNAGEERTSTAKDEQGGTDSAPSQLSFARASYSSLIHSLVTPPSTSSKSQTLDLLQCGCHFALQCRTLVPPTPPLPCPGFTPWDRTPHLFGYAVGRLPVRGSCTSCIAALASAVQKCYNEEAKNYEHVGVFVRMSPVTIVRVHGPWVDVKFQSPSDEQRIKSRRYTIVVSQGGKRPLWEVTRTTTCRWGHYALQYEKNVRKAQVEAALP